MSYAVKEVFLTLQGEGVQSGRRAVFLRFAGCNLWSGLEKDRASAVCQFCDTDFVGMDGENGGRYDADTLAGLVAALWGKGPDHRYVVITGGEPMLQVDGPLMRSTIGVLKLRWRVTAPLRRIPASTGSVSALKQGRRLSSATAMSSKSFGLKLAAIQMQWSIGHLPIT
jgi:hypothetical protein